MGPSLWHVSLLLMSLAYLVGGRPPGCIIPKPLGPDPVAYIFVHLSKLICSPCLTCQLLSPARSSLPRGLHTGTALVHGSVPATSTNLSCRALARGMPRARHLTRPSVPSPHLRATSGRLAAVPANHVSSCACSQGSHGEDSRRHRESPFLSCNSLVR